MDPVNYLPRVRIPTLMVNGRYDFYFPIATFQIPMFRLLGTPPDQKRHVIEEGSHFVPRIRLIQETLAWLDQYQPVGRKGAPLVPLIAVARRRSARRASLRPDPFHREGRCLTHSLPGGSLGRKGAPPMPNIPFTNNYQDLSSQRGFQFKFMCEKCGNGYLSTFQANRLGAAAAAADVAASLFGGIFGRAARTADQLQAMAAGPQHDGALDAAVREISPLFKQCTRCGNWICEPVCWNKKAGLCEVCAPDLDEEIASAQAVAARDQAMEKARKVDFLGQRDLAQVASAVCPACGVKTQGGKFCPECGATIAAKRKCAHCGTEADGTPKFCPECGKPYGA